MHAGAVLLWPFSEDSDAPSIGLARHAPFGMMKEHASLAGSYVGFIDLESGQATLLKPPTHSAYLTINHLLSPNVEW